jgi:hypothetical protein
MTLPRLYDLSRYWKDHPPTHILVAGFLGYKPKEEMEESPDELVAAMGAAGLTEKK